MCKVWCDQSCPITWRTTCIRCTAPPCPHQLSVNREINTWKYYKRKVPFRANSISDKKSFLDNEGRKYTLFTSHLITTWFSYERVSVSMENIRMDNRLKYFVRPILDYSGFVIENHLYNLDSKMCRTKYNLGVKLKCSNK